MQRHLLGRQRVERDDRGPQRVRQRHLGGCCRERGAQVREAFSEPAPDDVVLGTEVAKERPAADSGCRRDVVDGGRVEAALGEQPHRDALDVLARGHRRAWHHPTMDGNGTVCQYSLSDEGGVS